LLTRPVGRPSYKPVVRFKSFLYQAASWPTARRAAAADELGGCAFVFTNLDDMPKELGAWMEDPLPKMMIVGELQDGLVFEKAYKKVTGKPLSHWIIQSRSSCDEAARPVKPLSGVEAPDGNKIGFP